MEAKVKENPDLVKNTSSGSVVNTNTSNYLARKAKKASYQKNASELNSLKSEIEELKNIIKSMAG